jgi:RimJ/RimL family protein N-acetyltransferase
MPHDLRLEPFTTSHLEGFASLTDDPEVLRFTRFPDPPEPGFPRAWLDRYERGRRAGSCEAFAVLGADGAFLGVGLAPHIDRPAAEAELGYVIAPGARGRGVATETVRRLTRWAFDEQALLRLTLIIDVANTGSQKVAQRCGYVREGLQRNAFVKPGVRSDALVYSRLPSDPEPDPAPAPQAPATPASGAPHDSRSSGGGTL